MTAFNFSTVANGTSLNALDTAWQKRGSVAWPVVQSGELTWSGWGENEVYFASGAASYSNVSRVTLEAAPYGKNGPAVLATSTAAGYVARLASGADGSDFTAVNLEKNGAVLQYNFASNLTLDGNAFHEIMLVCSGDAGSVTLELWINGTLVNSLSDTPPQAGWPGIFVSDAASDPAQYNVKTWSSAAVDFTEIAGVAAVVPSVSAALDVGKVLESSSAALATASGALNSGIELQAEASSLPASIEADLWTKTGGLSADERAYRSITGDLNTDIQLHAEAASQPETIASLSCEISLSNDESSGLQVMRADGSVSVVNVPADWMIENNQLAALLASGAMALIDLFGLLQRSQASGALEVQTLLDAVSEARAAGVAGLEALKLLKADTGSLPLGLGDLSTWGEPGEIHPIDPRAEVFSQRAALIPSLPLVAVIQHRSGVARVLH
ncbi:MAG: hypothetical protein ACWA5X_05720 [bacterium]